MNILINDKDFLVLFFWNYIHWEQERNNSTESED